MKPYVEPALPGDRPSADWANSVKNVASHDHSGALSSDGENHIFPAAYEPEVSLYELTADPELDTEAQEYKATAKICVMGFTSGAPGSGYVRYSVPATAKDETVWFITGQRDGSGNPTTAPNAKDKARVFVLSKDGILVVVGGGSEPRFAWATTSAAVATTDATFTATDIVPCDGSTWSGDDPLTVNNDPAAASSNGFEFDISVVIKIMYCKNPTGTDWGWHAFDGPCPA